MGPTVTDQQAAVRRLLITLRRQDLRTPPARRQPTVDIEVARQHIRRQALIRDAVRRLAQSVPLRRIHLRAVPQTVRLHTGSRRHLRQAVAVLSAVLEAVRQVGAEALSAVAAVVADDNNV